MEKPVLTGPPRSELDAPETALPCQEPNATEEGERGHAQEPERVVEWGGPSSRYGKINVILGKGAYKVVWKAIDKEEGIEVAWNCCQTTRSEFNEFSEEVEILKKVRHPNVITFHDSWYASGEFVFITELMTSGTLREYVKKLKNPSVKIIKRWARQILRALQYLHSHSPPIIHRDIKCDNIFINGPHGEVKIGDMGTAKMRFGKKYTVIGTPEFMAPEMYEEKGYSEKVDIYAFGMCLLEMFTGEYPYAECKNAAQIYKKVTQGIKPDCLSKIQDKEILSLISSCLASEAERWSAKKLADHPFFLDDPEVQLLSVNENRTRLKLQVLFKGHEKHTIKFEYNRETDTAEDVVREMIEEKVLAAKFQGLVCNEIHRILRDLAKAASVDRAPTNPASPLDPIAGGGSQAAGASHRRLPSDLENLSLAASSSRSRSRPRQIRGTETEAEIVKPALSISYDGAAIMPGISSARRNSLSNISIDLRGSDSFETEVVLFKDYPNDYPIEEFILEVASSVNRTAEKANEWLTKLKNEDLATVKDLRELLDEDWVKLNLTVFATRVIKNALRMSTARANKSFELLSPRISGRITETSNPPSSTASSIGSNNTVA